MPFRVLIVGGGVVGLTLANALEKADVDYLVLEKRDIAPQLGASISVLSHIARVFTQLGIWDVMRKATFDLGRRHHFDENGYLFDDSNVFSLIANTTGRPVIFMERCFYLQCLFDNLKDKSKVRARCGLHDFSETDDGVSVITDTGETIQGSILVGADGIYSTVRQLMAKTLEKSTPKIAKSMTEGFVATYKAVFGASHNHFAHEPGRQFLPDGMIHNVYYRGLSGAAAAGAPDRVFWFLFIKLKSPARTPNCPRYTNAHIEAVLKEYGGLSLGAGYTFNDLWTSRITGGMVPLEEGVLQARWSSKNRTVLMGDSAAKSTINAGFGGNTGIEGVVVFTNELVALLRRCGPDTRPSTQDLVVLFDRYEDRQRPRADWCVNFSGYLTRYDAMDTWWLRLLRRLSAWAPDRLKAKLFFDFMAPAPIFDFLPDPDAKEAPVV